MTYRAIENRDMAGPTGEAGTLMLPLIPLPGTFSA